MATLMSVTNCFAGCNRVCRLPRMLAGL